MNEQEIQEFLGCEAKEVGRAVIMFGPPEEMPGWDKPDPGYSPDEVTQIAELIEANRPVPPVLSGRERYKRFLKTPPWKALRRRKVEASNGNCDGCGAYLGTGGHVHHVNRDGSPGYPQGWLPWDLALLKHLCEGCHNREHLIFLN